MYGLTDEAQEMLMRIFSAHSALPFPAEQAGKLRPPAMCRAELALVLLELRQEGWLELRQKLWGEAWYRIPELRIPQILHERFPVALSGEDNAVITGVEGGPNIAGELFRALVFMSGAGLMLTAKGEIHKAAAGRFAAALKGNGQAWSGLLPVASEAAGNLSAGAAVLLDLLFTLGLAVKEGGAITLVPETLAGWLKLTEAEMNDILYRVLLARYGAREPELLHFRYWISGSRFAPGRWAKLPEVLAELEQAGLTAGQPVQMLQQHCESWLTAMAGCGWMELGGGAGGERCFRWTEGKPRLAGNASHGEAGSPAATVNGEPAGHAAAERGRNAAARASFIVQPDLEVLVPPEVPYSVRWTLAACAELEHSEELWSFRLSRERLEQAAEHGLDPEQAIAWLAGHADGGLPEQAGQALRLWSKGIGRTVLSEAILLTCRSLEDAAVIAAHPRLRLMRLGPLHFAVAAADVAALRKELAAAGLAPPRAFAGQEAAAGALQQLFIGGSGAQPPVRYALPPLRAAHGPGAPAFTELPLVPATPAEQAAEEGGVPLMWLKEWRHYHASTAREMMEHALEYGLKVQIAVSGEACVFIPERSHGAPWRVLGILLRPGSMPEETVLAAGEWQEMKLLPPGGRRNSSSAATGGYGMIRKSTGTP
ncbi:helicase-associated domain-containing protein [Paenibacillus tengchongensis]|uniref:helicase-associated domain-containing protein n=1 Tax=Paenibacillus tengchongensis TaxID=2608684 RepID=UPI00124C6705|nr:helicase-associated domain-containing protein [Paenibacillus tengchongensis]